MTPAAMNIHKCPPTCPSCHACCTRKHGQYTRNGFHSTKSTATVKVTVPRYRCLNPRCKRVTFSILPPGVLPFCRFRWKDLLSIRQALDAGQNAYHLACHVWHVGLGVIGRTRTRLASMLEWVEARYRELTDGMPAAEFERMVNHIMRKIGRLELLRRWCCHSYSQRAFPQNRVSHKLTVGETGM